MKDVKAPRKMIDREKARLSKKEKKALAAAGRGGNGESMRPAVFADRRYAKAERRPNVVNRWLNGKYD